MPTGKRAPCPLSVPKQCPLVKGPFVMLLSWQRTDPSHFRGGGHQIRALPTPTPTPLVGVGWGGHKPQSGKT